MLNKIEELLAHDSWAASSGERGGAPFVLRFRTPVIAPGDVVSHRSLLQVVWIYADEDSGAMPTDDDSVQMEVFENRLVEAWEHDALAFLAAVLTFDGARQWVFYTHDVATCGQRLDEMPQEEEPYPIELTTRDDPDGSYLRDEILKTVDWQQHQSAWEQALGAPD